MADKKKADAIKIRLGGKERALAYDMNAICRFDEATGQNFLGGLEFEKLSAAHARALIWAGLLRESPDLTPEDVGAMIDMRNLAEVFGGVAKAITAALAGGDES